VMLHVVQITLDDAEWMILQFFYTSVMLPLNDEISIEPTWHIRYFLVKISHTDRLINVMHAGYTISLARVCCTRSHQLTHQRHLQLGLQQRDGSKKWNRHSTIICSKWPGRDCISCMHGVNESIDGMYPGV